MKCWKKREVKTGVKSAGFKYGNGLELIFISSDFNKLLDKSNLFYPKKAVNDCKLLNDEVIAIFDEPLEYDCLTKEVMLIRFLLQRIKFLHKP